MISAIGIRANPNAIYYCVLNSSDVDVEIKIIDQIVIPKSLEVPEQLKYVRNTFKDIFDENKIKNACIRITESNAQRVNIPRIYLEGVIQELIASSTIEKYFVGQISNISPKLGIERAEFKPFVKGEADFKGLAIWKELDEVSREAVLAAFASITL